MNSRLIVLSTAAFFFIKSAAACAGQQMTLGQCIAKAIELHPSLTAAEGTIESDRAKASQQAVNSRLSASVRSGYTRSGSTKGVNSGSNDGDWSTGVTLSQLVYDWGKTGTAVKSAKLTTQAAEKTAARTRETVIAGVRDAYYALNKAVRDVEVQQEQVHNYGQRLEWAKTYYSVGTKAKIEVTKAETDLANARLALIKAESAAEQAKAQLASAIGDPALIIDRVKDELEFADWSIEVEEALKRAQANRPDLAAEELLVKKAEMDLKSAKLTNAPSVSASAGYNFGGTGYYDDDQWTTGLTLLVPVGDGGETKARTAQAKADLKVASANRDKLLQDVVLDVRTAWQSLRESAASITAARAAEKQARENLDLALGRYRAGVGDSLEVSDAVDSYASARSTVIASLYDHKEARLNLEKAMGEVSEL